MAEKLDGIRIPVLVHNVQGLVSAAKRIIAWGRGASRCPEGRTTRVVLSCRGPVVSRAHDDPQDWTLKAGEVFLVMGHPPAGQGCAQEQ